MEGAVGKPMAYADGDDAVDPIVLQSAGLEDGLVWKY
jgi:hypothetical protein